jgi:N-methylhydantoinase B
MRLGELELLRESLVAVVSEMRANVIHASFSSIIYEGRDFSCGLLTHDGRLLAQSLDDNPIHIFAVPYSAREIIRRYGSDITPGDVFLHNDPYTGGTHLNDILAIEPIFAGHKLLAFAAVRAHWGDVGGMTAGSISGRATEIFQEGVRIPPIRVAKDGTLNQEIMDLLFANMRVPTERVGDFNTMVGASRKAAEHVGRLVRRFGESSVLFGIETLIANAEMVMRQKIRSCTNGEYCTEGYIESNGQTDEPLVARLRLTVLDDTVHVNFWDASPQTAGPTNVGPAMAINSAGTILKAFLDPAASMNHGSFQPIVVTTPERTFINARPPVACGGSVEVKVLLDALIAGALGQAVPEKMVGDLKGGGNHIYLSGQSSGTGYRRFFLFYEYPAGGTGATARGDGGDATRTYTEGDFNTFGSAEVIEGEMPLVVEQVSIRTGSHGHGMYRGGCGIVRDIRILEDNTSLSVLTDKAIIPPYGVGGAHAGKGNSFRVFRNNAVVETSPIPGKIAGFRLNAGDLVRMETSGGGGYGNPLQRAPEFVARDVALGYTDRATADHHYGVVVGNDGTIDETATARQRAALTGKAIWVVVGDTPNDHYQGARRLFVISSTLADALAVHNGALCELVNPRGPSLRGWVSVAEPGDERLPLGPFARAILRCSDGDRFELRAID